MGTSIELDNEEAEKLRTSCGIPHVSYLTGNLGFDLYHLPAGVQIAKALPAILFKIAEDLRITPDIDLNEVLNLSG